MQVNRNVNEANFLQVGNQSRTSSKADRKQSSNDFASCLTNVQDNFVSKVNVMNQAGTSKQLDVSSRQANNQRNRKTIENTSIESDKKNTELSERVVTDQKNVSKTTDSTTRDVKETSGGKTAGNPEDEITEAMEAVSDLLQTVMEQFQLTAAELSDKLEEFGMELMDLLTQEGLKEFFLNMNSMELSDLVVDENLNLELQSFMTELEELLQTLEAMDVNVAEVLAEESVESMLAKASNGLKLEEIFSDEQNTGSQSMQEGVAAEPEVIVSTQTQNALSDDDSSLKHQTKDSSTSLDTMESGTQKASEKPNDFENPILQAINDAMNQVDDAVAIDSQPVKSADVINQIVEQVKVHMSQDNTSLEMQLYPEHLGKIQISVVAKDGVMTARIVAENEAAKQAIEQGLTNLKEALEQQNLKVEAIEVMVSTAGFDQRNEEQGSAAEKQTSKSNKKLDLSQLEDEVEEDAVEVEKMRAMGSSVSYTA